MGESTNDKDAVLGTWLLAVVMVCFAIVSVRCDSLYRPVIAPRLLLSLPPPLPPPLVRRAWLELRLRRSDGLARRRLSLYASCYRRHTTSGAR